MGREVGGGVGGGDLGGARPAAIHHLGHPIDPQTNLPSRNAVKTRVSLRQCGPKVIKVAFPH